MIPCKICGAGEIKYPENKYGEEIFVAPAVHKDWCPYYETS